MTSLDLSRPAGPVDRPAPGNALLASLPPDEHAALARLCRPVELPVGTVVTEPDAPIPFALFPDRGIVSVVRRDARGERTEVCLIGREGFAGAPILLGGGRWPYHSFVQISAVAGLRVEADALLAAVEQCPVFNQRLLGAVQAQLVQLAEGLVSAAWQRISARLARWLLMCRDRSGSDRIEATHEFMAMMVGAQRPGLTVALHELEGEGLIAATRGQVLIRDVAGLERATGGSYGTAEREAARLAG